jgi:hypothetical protein
MLLLLCGNAMAFSRTGMVEMYSVNMDGFLWNLGFRLVWGRAEQGTKIRSCQSIIALYPGQFAKEFISVPICLDITCYVIASRIRNMLCLVYWIWLIKICFWSKFGSI